MAGADIRYIPYRTTPQATADLIGGRISMIWLSSLGNLAGSGRGAADRRDADRRALEPVSRRADLRRTRPEGLRDHHLGQHVCAEGHAAGGGREARPPRSTRRWPIPRCRSASKSVGIVKPRATGPAFLKKYLSEEIEKWGDILRTTKDTRLGTSFIPAWRQRVMSKKRIVFQGEPGANSHLAISEAYPGRRGRALRDLRGRVHRAQRRRRRPRHDPDRELGGRPRRRHPSPDAELQAAHRRRAFHAGAATSCSASRARSSKTSRPSRATSTRSASAARSSASSASSRSSPPTPRARRARSPSAATRPAPRIATAARRRNLRPRHPRPRTSRTRRTTPRASSCCRARRNGRRAASGKVVTTFVFRVRNVPAALYKAMGGFATNGINMTKLESYMIEGKFFATQFYADVEGHPDDRGLVFALEELAFFSKELTHPRRLSGASVPRDIRGSERPDPMRLTRRAFPRRQRRRRARARRRDVRSSAGCSTAIAISSTIASRSSPNQGYTPPDFPLEDYLGAGQAARRRGRRGRVRLVPGQRSDLPDGRPAASSAPAGSASRRSRTTIPTRRSRSSASSACARSASTCSAAASTASMTSSRSPPRCHAVAGWHSEIYADAAALAPHVDKLSKLPQLCIDHLGMTEAGVPVLLDLVAAGCKVKATGFGRGQDGCAEGTGSRSRRKIPTRWCSAPTSPRRAPRGRSQADRHRSGRDACSGAELAQKAFWDNPLALYRVKVA